MILGLDISTSITGYAIIDTNGKLQKIGSWDMRNKNHYPEPNSWKGSRMDAAGGSPFTIGATPYTLTPIFMVPWMRWLSMNEH